MKTSTSEVIEFDLERVIVERREVLAGCMELIGGVRELRVTAQSLARQVAEHEREGMLKILKLEQTNKQLGYDIKARDNKIEKMEDAERRLREQLADWKATAAVNKDRIYELQGTVRSLELDIAKAHQKERNREQDSETDR